MSEFYLDSDDIRYLLQNAGKIKKEGRCIECHPVYKDNFIKYELYEYTEDDVENFKKETLNKEFK